MPDQCSTSVYRVKLSPRECIELCAMIKDGPPESTSMYTSLKFHSKITVRHTLINLRSLVFKGRAELGAVVVVYSCLLASLVTKGLNAEAGAVLILLKLPEFLFNMTLKFVGDSNVQTQELHTCKPTMWIDAMPLLKNVDIRMHAIDTSTPWIRSTTTRDFFKTDPLMVQVMQLSEPELMLMLLGGDGTYEEWFVINGYRSDIIRTALSERHCRFLLINGYRSDIRDEEESAELPSKIKQALKLFADDEIMIVHTCYC